MTWAVGMLRDADDYGEGASDGRYGVTGRVTFLPLYQDKGRQLIHVGGAYSLHRVDSVRFRQRPEAHLSPRFVNTGSVTAEWAHRWGVETAAVFGPFSIQGEYIGASLDGASQEPTYCGFYVQASFFLTGEHRRYKTSSGAFDRVKPLKNFREDGGLGAWEIAVRYSHLNLNDSDEGVTGGRLKNATIGLNWYLNPNIRIMWNYIHVCGDIPGESLHDAEADIFMMRFQVDF
jgi:phosphate-selective porin OprO/OprP